MKIILLIFAVCISSPSTVRAQPIGSPTFHIGRPIFIEFRYEGGIERWNGQIAVSENKGSPQLHIAQPVFLVVSKGQHDFVPEKPNSSGILRYWQTAEALHGKLVPPFESRVSTASYNVSFKQPFRTVIDITKFYKIDTVGTYFVYWGIPNLWTNEFSFEVTTKGPRQKTTYFGEE